MCYGQKTGDVLECDFVTFVTFDFLWLWGIVNDSSDSLLYMLCGETRLFCACMERVRQKGLQRGNRLVVDGRRFSRSRNCSRRFCTLAVRPKYLAASVALSQHDRFLTSAWRTVRTTGSV